MRRIKDTAGQDRRSVSQSAHRYGTAQAQAMSSGWEKTASRVREGAGMNRVKVLETPAARHVAFSSELAFELARALVHIPEAGRCNAAVPEILSLRESTRVRLSEPERPSAWPLAAL